MTIAMVVAVIMMMASAARAQEWNGRVRGAWVREGAAQGDDVVIADEKGVCDIVVADSEHSAVKRAAEFLAGDIEKITGKRPAIVSKPVEGHRKIQLWTAPNGQQTDKWPWKFGQGVWEAYQVRTIDGDVHLVGSDFRGTGFAAYTLSERLGIDPLYLWTGYMPERRATLVMKGTDYVSGPPTFKYRGMFHDDEDILPRPFEASGYPLRVGDVPLEWYEKFFETALRLRMNMVAPYTRVHRRYEVQKTASDWGLFYTSHHYDILLSNPFGIERYGLGEKRHAGTKWDWLANREGMLNYWRGGVEENKDLDCIWPVGMRGTDDTSYVFPRNMKEAERQKIFREVIETQVKMTGEIVPKDRPPVFHFTMYNEMLNEYLKNSAAFGLPQNVIVVWTDDNDGAMRFLPADLGQWKHGVYYHLAYLGKVAKQNAHIVTPARIATEFRKIIDAGATEYMLVNVSELREFVMEARMIGEIAWDGNLALKDTPKQPRPSEVKPFVPSTREAREAASQPASEPSGDRYVRWWCEEYFGAEAGPLAAKCYQHYYKMLKSYDRLWYGSERVELFLDRLEKKFEGKRVDSSEVNKADLLLRLMQYQQLFHDVDKARASMNREQRQFFFDHVELPMLMDFRPTQAAMMLSEAIDKKDEDAWAVCEAAMEPLEKLEVEILRAEHPPFEGWYRKTWIRRETSNLNVHRPYEQLRAFLSSGGKEKLQEPANARRPVFPVRKD